jgi:hypothetical protein
MMMTLLHSFVYCWLGHGPRHAIPEHKYSLGILALSGDKT